MDDAIKEALSAAITDFKTNFVAKS